MREDPEARERALDALALSRREAIPLSRASRAVGTTPRTVLRYAPSGFRRIGRRYQPTPFDRIPRQLTVLTADGPETITVRDSRTASLVAEHSNAVRAYIERGDEEPLGSIHRRTFTVAGRKIELALDPDTLDRLAEGGELHYELYQR